jgi:hypothetical protein
VKNYQISSQPECPHVSPGSLVITSLVNFGDPGAIPTQFRGSIPSPRGPEKGLKLVKTQSFACMKNCCDWCKCGLSFASGTDYAMIGASCSLFAGKMARIGAGALATPSF